MWRIFFLSNRDAVLKTLDRYVDGLGRLHGDRSGRCPNHDGVFSRAKVAQEHFTKMLEQKSYKSMNQEKRITFVAHSKGRSAVTSGCRVTSPFPTVPSCWVPLADGVTEIEGFLEVKMRWQPYRLSRDMVWS